MRHVRCVLIWFACGAALLATAGAASAHPLGNFTINHLSQVSISRDTVDVHYILDQAEIPTFQERAVPADELLARKRTEVVRGLLLTVDGRQIVLASTSRGRLTKPPGQGALPLTRVELDLRAPLPRAPRAVRLRDETFPARIGWKAIVVRPGHGTAVRSADAYSSDPTNGLRRYPAALLQSPLDRRAATFDVRPGDGRIAAARAPGGGPPNARGRGGDGFASVFADAAAGRGVLLFLLLASFAWGAFHALSPGHGKAMVAAYLVGTRGSTRHALSLGVIVTITHTIGVFALGLITLGLSQWILPEDLYPWLNLVAGLMVVIVGIGVLRSRVRLRAHAATHHHHHGGHSHSHSHDHSHHPPEELTWRGLLGMGTAAGLIPCPSALVVLLGAIAQHQIALGLLLIVTFSLGLATTLCVLGLIVVHSRARLPRSRLGTRVTAALPSLSAIVILAAGCVLTLQAIPTIP